MSYIKRYTTDGWWTLRRKTRQVIDVSAKTVLYTNTKTFAKDATCKMSQLKYHFYVFPVFRCLCIPLKIGIECQSPNEVHLSNATNGIKKRESIGCRAKSIIATCKSNTANHKLSVLCKCKA